MNLKEERYGTLLNLIDDGDNQDIFEELASRLEAGEKAIEELEKYKMICLRQKRIWKLEE